MKQILICLTAGVIALTNLLGASDISIPTSEKKPIQEMANLEFYAQAEQDKFVYMLLYGLLGKQDKGHYLEIGAWHPTEINNSYFFEKNLNWGGVSIDISTQFVEQWKEIRQNPLILSDATQTDYRELLQSFPKVIDYLSLDIDRHYTDVLRLVPFDEYTFKIITMEHDSYVYGNQYREEERQILSALGYRMVCADVSNLGNPYEDWWVHPSFFTTEQLSLIASLDLNDKEHTEIIQILQRALKESDDS